MINQEGTELNVGDKLLQSSFIVSFYTGLSRILGLARDVVIARFFGAEDAADAFFVAFKIPNFFRRLFAEGAFSQAFIPVLSDYKVKLGAVEEQKFISSVFTMLATCLFFFIALAVIFSDGVTYLFAFGFTDTPIKFELTANLLQITFTYLFFISLTSFSAAILNTYQNFSIPASTPIILNIVLIVAAFKGTDYFSEPVYALAWGVCVAGIVQFLFHLPFLKKIDRLPKIEWRWKDNGVNRVLKLMLPAVFGVSVSQINLLLDTLIASFLITGSVSWLYYSDRLIELPLGVFGIAIATVILPKLSSYFSTQDNQQGNSTIDWAIKHILIIGLPASIALAMLAKPILSTLFQYGAMGVEDINMASYSLLAYSSGLLGFMLIKVFVPVFYARKDTKTPVKIGIISMVTNMVLNVVFVLLFMRFDIGHVGLALATSVSAWVNAGMLLRVMLKNGLYVPQKKWGSFLIMLIIANFGMVIMLYGLNAFWYDVEQWHLLTVFQRCFQITVICISGLLTYTMISYALGVKKLLS